VERRFAHLCSRGAARLAAAGYILSSLFFACVLERLLGEIPGNPLDPPVAGRMSSALPRLPWLRDAASDRPDTTASVDDAAVELLCCYALCNGVAALTQGNLKVLDGKCKAALAGSLGKPGSHKFDRVRSIGIAAQTNASGHGGDGRNRYDAVAYEGYAQYLTGNNANADTRTLLQTNLSSVRRVFFGKQAPMSITLLAHASSLTTSVPTRRTGCARTCAPQGHAMTSSSARRQRGRCSTARHSLT
jgi:hypothetical protein